MTASFHDREDESAPPPRAAALIYPVFWMQPTASESRGAPQSGAAAKAILFEIRARAETLLACGETSSIDLRFMKLIPDERARLVSLLGNGEVSAIVTSIGRSEVLETAIACVWWVRHFNSDDEVVGELIEIAEVPDLLRADRTAIAAGLDALHALLAADA